MGVTLGVVGWGTCAAGGRPDFGAPLCHFVTSAPAQRGERFKIPLTTQCGQRGVSAAVSGDRRGPPPQSLRDSSHAGGAISDSAEHIEWSVGGGAARLVRPPLSLRDISPRFAGERFKIPLTTQCGQRGVSGTGLFSAFPAQPRRGNAIAASVTVIATAWPGAQAWALWSRASSSRPESRRTRTSWSWP